jgi:arabinofuranosyltransferase
MAVLLARTSWQADDAYAAWRLVDNFVNGNGLRYNLDERVQTFTSTLWTFLVASVYYFTGNIYYTSIFLSITLTLLAVAAIAFPHRRHIAAVLVCYITLGMSVAFTDFAAAGFENPLSYFLLAAFSYLFFNADLNQRGYFRLFCALAALAALNRLDTPAFYIPPILHVLSVSKLPSREKFIGVSILLAPVLLWHCFALFYFGFPLQNAAYAKRFNNLPLLEYVKAGIDYYLNSINRDPVTLTVIFSAIALAAFSAGVRVRVFSFGVFAYLLYVVFIGGDYMSGRFFSVPLFASVIILLNSRVLNDVSVAVSTASLIIVLGLLSPHAPFLNDRTFGQLRGLSPTSEWEQRGIADERASWYQHSGLLLASRFAPMPRETPEWPFRKAVAEFEQSAEQQQTCVGMIMPTGYFGFYAAKNCHIYDLNGQVEPLMARLPASYARNWRQGHLFKPEPKGLRESFRSGSNRIEDPDLALYYEKLRIITHGELLSFERLKTIWTMNLGGYNRYLDAYAHRQETHK